MTSFLCGMFAAACLITLGAALALLWMDVRNKRDENARLERVVALAERKGRQEVRR